MTWFFIWLLLVVLSAALQGWLEAIKPTGDEPIGTIVIFLFSLFVPIITIPFFVLCLAKHYGKGDKTKARRKAEKSA